MMLSSDMLREILLKLDSRSVKAFGRTNHYYRTFCEKKVWKSLVKRDFPTKYQNIPLLLTEPDWRRVYCWFEKYQELSQKFKFDSVDLDISHCYKTMLFSFDHPYGDIYFSKSHNFDAILGTLINLGLNENLCHLNGTYMNKYIFSITYMPFDSTMTLHVRLSPISLVYVRFIDELRKFILMTEPISYKRKINGMTFTWTKKDQLFKTDIPNYSYLSPYNYLYIPQWTIDIAVPSNDTYYEYINIFRHLEWHRIPLSLSKEDFTGFYVNVLDLPYPYGYGCCVFGVYYGTPFRVRADADSDNKSVFLWLSCPAKNIQPLMDCMVNIIKEFNGKHESN